MKVLDLFSGIGGFSLGLERAGMETIAFCEKGRYQQKILKKHWPDVKIYENVRLLDATKYRDSVDVVCGGFPCQDVSSAGKKAGINSERSGLYREMLRIISECLPGYAIFENVTGLLTGDQGRWFAQFLYDLAAIGYDAEWHCISASYLGATHHRNRVWIVAYPNDKSGKSSDQGQTERQNQKTRESIVKSKISANSNSIRCKRSSKISHFIKKQVELMRGSKACRDGLDLSEPALCGANDGVSYRLDRLKCLGNSVVPQIPEAIGRAIIDFESNSGQIVAK